MKLLASLLTTVGITGAVWGTLHIQPAIADASTAQPITESSTNKSSIDKQPKNKPVEIKQQATAHSTYLQGLSKTIPLEDVPELWVDFYQNLEANDEEIAQQQKVIVVYQEISSDFSEATITIGFPTEQIKLEPLIDNIIESQRYLLKNKEVEIHTKVEQGEHSLPRELTDVVLTNLVRNAFQHGGSGDIRITLTEHQFEVTNRLEDENLANDSDQQTSFGIGLELIDRVCLNQGWQFTHETNNNEFIVKVIL